MLFNTERLQVSEQREIKRIFSMAAKTPLRQKICALGKVLCHYSTVVALYEMGSTLQINCCKENVHFFRTAPMLTWTKTTATTTTTVKNCSLIGLIDENLLCYTPWITNCPWFLFFSLETVRLNQFEVFFLIFHLFTFRSSLLKLDIPVNL